MTAIKQFLFAFFLLVGFAFAGKVEDFIMSVSATSSKIINSKSKTKEQDYLNFVEDIVYTDWIAKFVLGPNARSLSPDELDEFKEVYKKYLLQNYLTKIQDYTGKFEIGKVVEKSKGVFVASVKATGDNGTLVNVDFRIVDNEGKLLITDIVPEGISFIGSQRTDITGEIQRSGFKKFMVELRKKAGIK